MADRRGRPTFSSARATCSAAASVDAVQVSFPEADRAPSSRRADHLKLLEPTFTTRMGATVGAEIMLTAAALT